MTQRISDKWLRTWLGGGYVIDGDRIVDDLLSLRAAVRRWIAAEDHARTFSSKGIIKEQYSLAESAGARRAANDAYAALRAEMGGIDKDGGGKP